MSGFDLPSTKPAQADLELTLDEQAEWNDLEKHRQNKLEIEYFYNTLLEARDYSYLPLFDALSMDALLDLLRQEQQQPVLFSTTSLPPPHEQTAEVVVSRTSPSWKLKLTPATLTITPTI
jgi:hypothetical protein